MGTILIVSFIFLITGSHSATVTTTAGTMATGSPATVAVGSASTTMFVESSPPRTTTGPTTTMSTLGTRGTTTGTMGTMTTGTMGTTTAPFPTTAGTETPAPFTETDRTTTFEFTTAMSVSCPLAVTGSSHQWKTTIYGGKCYEIVAHSTTFNQAEADCKRRGGHLMHIQSAAEQDFITKYLKANYNHEVWIGLGDHAHEETWTWTSGVPLRYTHWDPSRKNFLIHGFEDCVVLEPSKQGYWDDRRCDGFLAAGHSYVCQYDARGPAVIIG